MESLHTDQRISAETVQVRRTESEVMQAIGSAAVDVELSYEYWQNEANCLGVDPDLFFPDRGTSTREAKEICRGCVVRLDCLEYALTNGEKFGIWGGLSERERRRLRRQRAVAAKMGESF